jgi:phenylacetate-CoA ligase
VALKQYRIQYLLGYTSSLFRLAEEALRLKIRIPMRVVVTNAEPLYEVQRAAIGEAFCCPVRESYGMAEAVAAASECEAGRLHLWPEAGIWEVLNDDCNAVRDGETGELISTGLVNMDMPLIRYRTGDRVRLPRRSEPSCKCGRTLPLVESIEGRLDEVLYTADGRQVGRLDPVFKANLPISAAQIIQEHLDELLVQYVPDGEFTKKDERSIVTRLTERLGPMKIVLQPVTEIERGANGKFRGVICRLSDTVKADVIRRSTNAKASCSYR